MLTFGKPTCRSHFWMRSSSSVFFTALSPMKHVSWFTFFLHFLVGGKHGGVKSSKPKVGQRQIEKLSKCKTTNLVKISHAHTYNQLLSVVVTPHMFCSVAWCVWKNTQIKRSEPSVSISNPNGEKSFHPWAETSGERTKWERTIFSLIYSTKNPNYKNTFDLLLSLQGPKLMPTKCQMPEIKIDQLPRNCSST